MKHLLLLALLALSCTKAPLHQAEPEAEYSGTRTDVRLEGTIWEHRTGEDFDRYVLFHEGTASLFYGIAEDGALHRYSDFYTAPYTYQDGALRTSISYPLWGNQERTESASVAQAGDAFYLYIDGDRYSYYGTDTSTLGDLWMTIIATPVPWE